MTNKYSEIAERVRKRRIALGLSKRQAAGLVGCSYSTMSRLEAGRQHPGPELLVRVADVFGMDARELFDVAGYPVPADLPELGPYVRMKFKDLPPNAFGEIETFVAFLRAKYGVAPEPRDGADEHPDGTPGRSASRT